MLTPSNPLLSRFTSTEALLTTGQEEAVVTSLTEGWKIIQEKGLSITASSNEDDFWPDADAWDAEFKPYKVDANGILHVPVAGTLVNDFDYTIWGMITGYQYIDRAVQRGMADEDVKGIALIINSGGGEVAGNFDLNDKIFLSRGKKPIAAIANEHAYSAAYSLASTADPEFLFMPRTGGVGSIGVVTTHVDASKYYERLGLKITYIHAGKHKVEGNPTEPLSKETKDRIQERIDRFMSIFVSTVARNRGLSEEAVRKTEALTYGAEEAVQLGLADQVMRTDEALAAFAAAINQSTTGVKAMATKPEATVTETVDTAAVAASVENARREGYAEGSQAERARIEGILGAEEAAQRPKMANHLAFKTAMSVDDAKGMLAVAGVEVTPPSAEEDKPAPKAGVEAEIFGAAMKNSAPNIGAEGTGDNAEDKSDSAEFALKAARVFGVAGLKED